MNRRIVLLCGMLAGCGAPADRLSDEDAAAAQNISIEKPVAIEVPQSTAPAEAPPPMARYSAIGTEPGWALTVTPARIRYEGDYGTVVITEPTPAGFRPVPGRYAGTRLTVTIAPGPCSDGMSDRTYRDTVTVTADGKTVSGCGGGTIAAPKAETAPAEDPPLSDGQAADADKAPKVAKVPG
jgi:uncharacterized membrane protein